MVAIDCARSTRMQIRGTLAAYRVRKRTFLLLLGLTLHRCRRGPQANSLSFGRKPKPQIQEAISRRAAGEALVEIGPFVQRFTFNDFEALIAPATNVYPNSNSPRYS